MEGRKGLNDLDSRFVEMELLVFSKHFFVLFRRIIFRCTCPIATCSPWILAIRQHTENSIEILMYRRSWRPERAEDPVRCTSTTRNRDPASSRRWTAPVRFTTPPTTDRKCAIAITLPAFTERPPCPARWPSRDWPTSTNRRRCDKSTTINSRISPSRRIVF